MDKRAPVYGYFGSAAGRGSCSRVATASWKPAAYTTDELLKEVAGNPNCQSDRHGAARDVNRQLAQAAHHAKPIDFAAMRTTLAQKCRGLKTAAAVHSPHQNSDPLKRKCFMQFASRRWAHSVI
jgi:hypothetical protein